MRRIVLTFWAAGLLAGAVATPALVKEEAEWRVKRQESLTNPGGWLTVAGLFWLHDGTLGMGSDPQSDVVLPANAPRHAGTLKVKAGTVTFEPAAGVAATVSGKPAGNESLKPDTDPHPDVLQIGTLALTVIKRMDRTGIRMRDPDAATRRNFTGCKWFPAAEKWRVKAKWVAYPEPKKIKIINILGMSDDEPSPGYAEFTIGGKVQRLYPVDEDGDLSFMFKDSTSGTTTYAPGRFLDADKPKDGFIVLDFNQAYNPPCAYIAFATCPLPPKENTLAIAVEGGEKKYGNHPGAGGR